MIRSNYTPQMTPHFRVLSKSQIEEIHTATLEVLRRTGVVVKDEEGRGLLKKAGCWLDGERVRIPTALVEWATRTCPPRVVLCDRNGKPAMFLEPNKVYYGTGSDTPNVIDPYTAERRPVVLSDVAGVAKVVDALPNISFLMCMGIASDVNEAISDLYHFKVMVENTTKPIVYTAWNLDNQKDVVAMAEAVAGGAEALQRNPFCALYTEPISPLQHATEAAQKLLYMAGKGLPVVYTPGLMIGASAPVTLAGGLVQANAELWSGFVMAQLKREGTPLIYGGGVLTMDMRTTLMAYGAPEFMLATCALTDMARYYRLPMFHFAGCTDAKLFDQQAALEGGIGMLLGALSGGNLVHDVGYIDNGLTASYEMLVAMDEVAGLITRFMGGVPVTDETMAVDLIDKVGPGGSFLGEEHTRRHYRENWFPKLLDRTNFDIWQANGAQTLAQRANARAREVLETHAALPIGAKIQTQLSAVIDGAEKRTRR
jgi:trimethylamine--corrinoid protein Co-methyltransferase